MFYEDLRGANQRSIFPKVVALSTFFYLWGVGWLRKSFTATWRPVPLYWPRIQASALVAVRVKFRISRSSICGNWLRRSSILRIRNWIPCRLLLSSTTLHEHRRASYIERLFRVGARSLSWTSPAPPRGPWHDMFTYDFIGCSRTEIPFSATHRSSDCCSVCNPLFHWNWVVRK